MKVKILIVDDEILQLNSIEKIIRRYRPDYEVTTTHQPMEALRLLGTQSFNALMVDVKMPQMNGIELIREARAMNIEPLEAIILSGFDDFQYAQSAISLEVLEYLLKPIDGTSLQRTLTKLEEKLEGDEMRRQMENDYSSMKSRQRAAVLFKKANGMTLTSGEEQQVGQFCTWMRMVLAENCDDLSAWLESMPAAACVEPLGQRRYLIFVPVEERNFSAAIPPAEKGMVIVSRPCRTEEMEQRWRELRQYADTARRMRLNLLVQGEWDHALLENLVRLIRAQDARAVRAMGSPLRLALQGGRLTMAALASAAEEEIARQVNEDLLPHVYTRRKQDLLKVLTEEIARCDSPEGLVEAVGNMLLSVSDEASDSFVQNVRIYIEAHYSTDCALNEISQAFHYSPAHFSRLFSSEFGNTYTRYLADFRLEKARELLMHSTLSVREIAQKVGIGDAGYLIRQFSRKFGVSPERYRRQG